MRTDKDEIIRLKKEIAELQLRKEPPIKEVVREVIVEKKSEPIIIDNSAEYIPKIERLEAEIKKRDDLIEALKSDILAANSECEMMRTRFAILRSREERVGNAIFDQ